MSNETLLLNDHKQSCDSASAEDKAEYPPMHKGEFEVSQTF